MFVIHHIGGLTFLSIISVMKVIADEYVTGGFRYKLFGSRVDNVAIYEQKDVHSGNIAGFEVVVIRKYKEGRVVFGTDVSGNEYLPSPSEWGKFGFSCYSIEGAAKKMMVLLKREFEREK